MQIPLPISVCLMFMTDKSWEVYNWCKWITDPFIVWQPWLVVYHPENGKMIEKKLSQNCGSQAEGNNDIPKATHANNLGTEIISFCLYCLLPPGLEKALCRGQRTFKWLPSGSGGKFSFSSFPFILKLFIGGPMEKTNGEIWLFCTRP